MKKLLEDNDLGFDLTKKSERFAMRTIKSIAYVNQLNDFYERVGGRGVEFAENCLKELMIEVECSTKSLDNIPSSGAFIFVANMPHGLLDGLLLLSIIGKKRPDTKIIGNFLLTQIEKLKDSIISVDPFSSKYKSNLSGIKQAKKHLKDGHPLIIFPADRVAGRSIGMSNFNETVWSRINIKFIQESNVSIIPAHIDGHCSLTFSLLGMIDQNLQAIYTGRELFKKEGRSYTVEIGGAIDKTNSNELESIDTLRVFLRTNILLLRNRTKQFLSHQDQETAKEEQKTENPLHEAKLEEIRESGTKQDNLLLQYEDYSFYVVNYKQIEQYTKSIFTNQVQTPKQYIVGVDEKKGIVFCITEIRYGGTTLGKGGVDDLLTHKYFEYSHKNFEIIHQSIEIGDKYIIPEVKRINEEPKGVRISTLIWQSAIVLLSRRDDYNYLLGTTSIGSQYSAASKAIISHFIETHATEKTLRKMAVPRFGIGKLKKRIFGKERPFPFKDMRLTNKLISDSNHNSFSMPSTLAYLIDNRATILTLSTNHKDRNKMNALVLIDKAKIDRQID